MDAGGGKEEKSVKVTTVSPADMPSASRKRTLERQSQFYYQSSTQQIPAPWCVLSGTPIQNSSIILFPR